MATGGSMDNIPSLKRDDGSWALNPKDKADLLADVFANKCRLDNVEENEFTSLSSVEDIRQLDTFVPIRLRYVRSSLKTLDEDNGAGPDLIAPRVLRRCRKELESKYL